MTQASSPRLNDREKAAEAIRAALVYFRRDALEARLPITAQAIDLALDAVAHDMAGAEPAPLASNVCRFPGPK